MNSRSFLFWRERRFGRLPPEQCCDCDRAATQWYVFTASPAILCVCDSCVGGWIGPLENQRWEPVTLDDVKAIYAIRDVQQS